MGRKRSKKTSTEFRYDGAELRFQTCGMVRGLAFLVDCMSLGRLCRRQTFAKRPVLGVGTVHKTSNVGKTSETHVGYEAPRSVTFPAQSVVRVG